MKHAVRAKRLREVLRRTKRLRTLGRFGKVGLRIARTALGPAGLFGVAVTGLLPGHLRLIRRAFHSAAVKKPQGRSITMDLEMLHPGADPAFQGLGLPLVWLTKVAAVQPAPRAMLKDCCRQAVAEMQAVAGTGRRRTSYPAQARGPVGAAVASALTLGWEYEGDLKWVLPTGERIDLCDLDPSECKLLVADQVGRWLWAQAAGQHEHLGHLDGRPCLGPMKGLVDSNVLTSKQKGLLKSI